jgi:hypothetical protein
MVGNWEFEIDLSFVIAVLEERSESKILQLIVTEIEFRFEFYGSEA